MPTRFAIAAMLTALAPTAFAADVDFEGSLQTRGRLYDTLSLTNELDAGLPEGRTLYAEHRLWLRPKFLLSDKIKLTVDFKGLDNVPWGERPFTTPSVTDDVILAQGLTAPFGETDPAANLLDFTIWRAWADIDTDFGRLSFGRMPLHWGMGIWQNDGMGLNAQYGDTVDRVQFEALVEDSVFIRASIDALAENFLNESDDTYGLSASAAYRSERFLAGLQVYYRHTDIVDGGNDLDLVTVDGAIEAELGKLHVQAEFLGQFGGGDLPNGLDDAQITGFGGVIDATLKLDKLSLNVQGGYASGDKGVDNQIKTFHFDPDHNVGVMLFEQPMPIFRAAAPNAANGNRVYDFTQLGDRVSNALYIKPAVRYRLLDGLQAEGAVLLARTAAVPDALANRRGYGTEIQAAAIWNGTKHFEVDARGAAFLPGTFFTEFTQDNIQGFDRTAFGAQVTGRVKF